MPSEKWKIENGKLKMESGVVFCSLFIFCKIYKMYNYFRKKGLQFRKEYDIISKSQVITIKKLVLMTLRVHPFPYRTRKLSSMVPKILCWWRHGKIGRCRHNKKAVQFERLFLFYKKLYSYFFNRLIDSFLYKK